MTILEDLAANSKLHWSDYVVLIVYFVLVIGVGIWSSCLNRGSVGGYFLAGRDMNWILVGASLFASNIGSGHFIGLAGSGAATGIGISIFELSAIFILLVLGWVFVPVYITSGVFTMPEYLKKRFGGERIRVYLAVLAVLLYVFTKISADLFAGAVFIEQSIGWDIWGSIIALLVLAMIFTIGGGLSAVIWTDFVQVIIMIIGAFVLMGISFFRIGGYGVLEEKFLGPDAWPNFTRVYAELLEKNESMSPEMAQYGKCGMTPKNSFHLVRSAEDGGLPWPGVFFGLTISGVWYWCSDQVIVQRALAAKNLVHAKAGAVLAGFLKFLPLFLMVIPGMISRLLFPEFVACADPVSCTEICGNAAGCSNIAYPLLVVQLMPNGARGLMLAVMMSALMSSLTSIFNSSSTIFTMDIWRRIRKNSSDMELMIVGRVFVLALVGLSIAWIPIIQNISELFHYIQGITSFLAPPVCAVYVLAVSWKRINEQGAFYGLMVGLAVGMVRFIWEFSYGPPPPCGEEDNRSVFISKVHYLHFGILLFVIVMIVTTVISLCTQPIDEKYLRRLTFSSRFEEGKRVERGSEEDNEEDDSASPEKGESGEGGSTGEDSGEGSSTGGEKMEGSNIDKLEGSVVPMKELNGGSETAIITETTENNENENNSGNQDLDVEAEDIEQRNARLPWYKKMGYWICGVENMSESSNEAAEPMSEELMNIDEDPFWGGMVNASAIVLMIGASVMIGYYA